LQARATAEREGLMVADKLLADIEAV
jgi:hypothetical protein